MKNIKILIAAHKKYKVPENDLYLPLQVGANGKESIGFSRDDTGDNISSKNPYYCELTGLYWAWKNLDVDYIGLCHYRRYFKGKLKFEINGKTKHILSRQEVEKMLEKNDIILPKKRHYYIETIYSHYKDTMYVEPLDEVGKIIKENYEEYYKQYEMLKIRRSAHILNMFIMKKEIFDKYCEWLFDILFKLENRIDPKQYDSFHARYLGRISERLLDIWINTNKYAYKEIKLESIEKQNIIKKVVGVLNAKFRKKKYEQSF